MAPDWHTITLFGKAFIKGLIVRESITRRRYQYSATRYFGDLMGVQVYNPYVVWPTEADVLSREWNQVSQMQARITERQYFMYSLSRSLAHVPGDTAECGVYLGATSFMMCLGAQEGYKQTYHHHAFDSFEGLSEPSKHDIDPVEDTETWQTGDLKAPLEQAQKNLGRFNHIHYYKGWIPERFDEIADRQFALVHIDVDLYQPTYDSLAFFYDKMVPGGVIVCDDYGSKKCPGAKKAFDEFIADKTERFVAHMPTGQGFITKGVSR